MTNTQLLQEIAKKSQITDEMVAQANKMLEQIANKNAKANENKKKKAIEEDAPIVALINEFFESHKSGLGNEVATYCKVSTSKAIALLKKMTEQGALVQSEVKLTKIGTRQMWKRKEA